jgi:demethylmenaquinone methyltransferase/2-methoxy-6-polyprenyl-1,4-benzoquinol methylase
MRSDAYSQTFGQERVTPKERQSRVGGVFASVASRYDIMNDVMSLGTHRLWKKIFLKTLPIGPKTTMIDVATGTGDIAISVMKAYPDGAPVVMVDPSSFMLKKANERLIDLALVPRGVTVQAPAEHLPFPDRSFDVCTISFGLRNVTHLTQALSEMRRVLVYGGHFSCMEFSPDLLPFLQKPYALYERIIPLMGRLIARDGPSYQYLVDSIRVFPPSDALVQMMAEAGFGGIRVTSLSGGLVRIHQGVRI